jgi:hydrophobe/amphiphile efflux-3 (HAE3) family protein
MKQILKLPFEYLADAINKRPFLVAGLVVAFLLLAVYGATLITMEEESENYLNKDNPVGILRDHYSDEFSSDFIIIIVEGEDVAESDVVRYLERFEEDLNNERYIESVSGLPDILKSLNSGVMPSNNAEIEGLLDTYDEDELEKILPSKTMTFVYVGLETETPYEANENLVNTVNTVIEMSHPPADISLTASGNPVYNYEVDKDISENMGNLILLAMLLMVVAMFFFFRHVRYRLLPVVIVFCGLVFTFGFMGLAGIPISSIVIAAFPVLIGIGIDYAIQFHSRFDEEIKKSTIKEAVFTTITSSGPSILLAMTATGLGFIALVIMAPFPMVKDFGIICLVGIACCYISAMIIVPTFASIVGYRPKEEKPKKSSRHAGKGSALSYNKFLSGVATKTAGNPVPVLIVLLMLAVAGIQLDNKVTINTDGI